MKKFRLILMLFILPVCALAQGAQYTGIAQTSRNMIGMGNVYVPIPGASVNICTGVYTGTACPSGGDVTVYSDQSLATVLTQPITADNWGNFSFWAAPGAYYFTVTGQGAASSSYQLTLPFGISGTYNATAKSIEQVRYADQFAGAGIGAKLTAAIADLGVGGGTVIVPRGSYTLSAPVVITQPNICIVGQGSQATSITSTVNGDAFKWDVGGVDPATPLQNGCLEGLTIYGNSQANATGVHIVDTTGLVLRDVALMNFTGSGSKGVYLDNEVAWTERTVFDHVTTQNNTYSYYFYKGASASGSFGYTSWLASHMQVNNGQVGVYIASGADLYHSTLGFKANLAPHNNGANSTLIEVAGTMNQDACSVTGEFTGTPVGTGTNYGIKNDTATAVSCPGIFDVASSVNSGPVFVGQSYEDGAVSSLWNTLPDGTIAFPTLTDRADNSLNNAHPYFGLYESNANSRTGFVFDFHNCINDGRCGVQLYTSSGATSGWLASATLVGQWGSDGSLRTSGPIQGFGTASSATSGFLLNWNETAGQGEIDIDDLFRAIQNPSPGFQFNVYDAGGVKHTVVTFDRTGSIAANGASFTASVALGAGGTLTGTLTGGTVNATTLQQGGSAVALASQLPLSGSIAGPTTSLAANTCGDVVTQTVTGATTTMTPIVTVDGALPTSGLVIQSAVTAANTVSIEYCNVTTAPITPAAATLEIRVVP